MGVMAHPSRAIRFINARKNRLGNSGVAKGHEDGRRNEEAYGVSRSVGPSNRTPSRWPWASLARAESTPPVARSGKQKDCADVARQLHAKNDSTRATVFPYIGGSDVAYSSRARHRWCPTSVDVALEKFLSTCSVLPSKRRIGTTYT